MLGEIESKRRKGQQKMRWLGSITDSMDMNFSKFREIGGFPGGSDGKESACNAGHLGLIPGLGRSPGERKSSGLENSMNCIGQGVAKELDTN